MKTRINRQQIQVSWSIITALLTLLGVMSLRPPVSAIAAASNPADVLKTMSAFDRTFYSGFTATGEETLTAGRRSASGGYPCPMQWKITSDGKRTAFTTTAKQILAGPAGQTSEGAAGGSSRTILVSRRYIFAPEFSAGLFAYCGPEDAGKQPSELDEASMSWMARFYPPDDPSLTFPLKRMVWSMGRGFSKYIDDLTEVKDEGDGRLLCRGVGRGLGSRPGRWELTIDVNAGYLVRSAKFFRGDEQTALLEMHTSGTKTVRGLSIAESADWSDQFGSKGGKIPLAANQLSVEPDAGFINEVHSKLHGPYPGSGVLIDYRATPPFNRSFKAGWEFAGYPWEEIPDLWENADVDANEAAATPADTPKSDFQAVHAAPDTDANTTGQPVAAADPADRPLAAREWWQIRKGTAIAIILLAMVAFAAYVSVRRSGISRGRADGK